MRKCARPNHWVSGNIALLFLYSGSYAVAVAPFTGAWIETYYGFYIIIEWLASLPSRERGLKLHRLVVDRDTLYVAPFTGAWIETT